MKITGFTLIELIIVMAIIAIAISTLVPSLVNSKKSANDSTSINLTRNVISLGEIKRQNNNDQLVYPDVIDCVGTIINSLPQGVIHCKIYQDNNTTYALIQSASQNFYYFNGSKVQGPLTSAPLGW